MSGSSRSEELREDGNLPGTVDRPHVMDPEISSATPSSLAEPGTQLQSLLTSEERSLLSILARRSLISFLAEQSSPEISLQDLPAALRENRACFVTLTRKGELRGCMGVLTPAQPLAVTVIQSAQKACSRDPRFPPVQPDELADISIEVTVLFDPAPLKYASPEELLAQLVPGRDGVLFQSGSRISTFLPRVWEQFREKAEFMNQLARKAGCEAGDWRNGDAMISVYQVEAWEEDSDKQQGHL